MRAKNDFHYIIGENVVFNIQNIDSLVYGFGSVDFIQANTDEIKINIPLNYSSQEYVRFKHSKTNSSINVLFNIPSSWVSDPHRCSIMVFYTKNTD